ncbi:SNF2 family N-terminal domain-containing protein [Cantharellus anzutake]|uniref:SNF2 family N-terminal domain-containing protein n=1 Tax=Cantharellus anzutake TaxID=1750568 RepID=UPI0019085C0B|nr:SNF2 family N-terminal domain-containing protein [Cantharellus anzutake]KAF8329124.1 SNF2 family N-terminal domain-containing protein [Cantharellus anzutake]
MDASIEGGEPPSQMISSRDLRLTPGRTFWVEIPYTNIDDGSEVIDLTGISPAPSQAPSDVGAGRMENNPSESSFGDKIDLELQEVVGEYKFGGVTWYYARLRSEVIQKFTREQLEEYPGLLEEYVELKSENRLEPFDPWDSFVRPRDRPSSQAPSASRVQPRRRARKDPETFQSETFTQPSDSDSLLSYEGSTSEDGKPQRRSTRTNAQKLNFSPRKLRGSTTNYSATSPSISVIPSDPKEEIGGKIPPLVIRIPGAPKFETINPEVGVVRDTPSVMMSMGFAPLCQHRNVCLKCLGEPTHIERRRLEKRRGRKREDVLDEEQLLEKQAGWVACTSCTMTYHFGCLPDVQRAEIVHGVRNREAKNYTAAIEAMSDDEELPLSPPKRHRIGEREMTYFVCADCNISKLCFVCCKDDLPTAAPAKPEPDHLTTLRSSSPAPASEGTLEHATSPPASLTSDSPQRSNAKIPIRSLLFRCASCRRAAHYQHLPPLQADESVMLSARDIAREYHKFGWKCKDCHSWGVVDKILAWRPYPPNAVAPNLPKGQVPPIKSALPREYLVKWVGKSYRHVEWVPHLFLLSRAHHKLSGFLRKGARIKLLDDNRDHTKVALEIHTKPDDLSSPQRARNRQVIEPEGESDEERIVDGPPGPVPNAVALIPPAWLLVDRILDVRFWKPPQPSKAKRRPARSIVTSDSEVYDDGTMLDANIIARNTLVDGEEPNLSLTETYTQRKRRTGKIAQDDSKDVVWAYIKWQDLAYSDATWDSPPREADGCGLFEKAFARYITAKETVVPILTPAEAEKRDARAPKQFKILSQPDWVEVPHLKLKPFQLEGFTWLWQNWWNKQPCILADEMGLGKTIQIISLIGKLVKDRQIFPNLIVVPNSTIANWVREFETWAPHVRVVMFSGSAESRDIIQNYELYHENGSLAYHVLIGTYEAITNPRDFNSVFKSVPRWEVVVIDEGQRVKSDSSLLFRRLKELNSIQRILMTGTPINNNVREVFNLMNLLDPSKWNNLNALERRFEVLTEQLVSELHELLRPYFLRRIKAEVMKDLPRKHEVIVPITMTKLQKEVYKSIMSQNPQVLAILAQSVSKANSTVKTNTNMNNALMNIRKCMQHPYLVNSDIEPPNLSNKEAHRQLVEASAKLRFLQMMLPKLKAKGHRVLLFSQFVIHLNIVEDFLGGEGIKYLRLDGNTPQAQRQKDMDAFNAPDSDYFIYLLTTRAGGAFRDFLGFLSLSVSIAGVGINLWSADVVIINDVDFNPQQDLQAIARAHRMGQKKPVLVFTLVIQNSAEEKIINNGKKKLVLDHVIVRKMEDKDNIEDVKSILSHGAKALFDETSSTELNYTSKDIDALIERAELEAHRPVAEEAKAAGSFGFAKVWERDDAMPLESGDAAALRDQAGDADFWASVLERSRLEEDARLAAVKTGRGVRRKATKTHYFGKQGKKGDESDVSEFAVSASGSIPDSDDNSGSKLMDLDDMQLLLGSQETLEPRHSVQTDPSSTILHQPQMVQRPGGGEPCRLCRGSHPSRQCSILRDPRVLVDLRDMIPDSTESAEAKAAAVRALDEHLALLGRKREKGQPPPTAEGHSSNPHSNAPAMKYSQTVAVPRHAVAASRSAPVRASKVSVPSIIWADPVPSASSISKKQTASRPSAGNPVLTSTTQLLEEDPMAIFLGNSKSSTSTLPSSRSDSASSSNIKRAPSPGTPPNPKRQKQLGAPSYFHSNATSGTSSANGNSDKSRPIAGSAGPALSGTCQICQRTPFHEFKRCPVLIDPFQIWEAIMRLQTTSGGSMLTVHNLKNHLIEHYPNHAKTFGLAIPDPATRAAQLTLDISDEDD